jgi:hypothetical protein
MKFLINYHLLSKILGISIMFAVLCSAVLADYPGRIKDIEKARGQIYDITVLNDIKTSNYMGNHELLGTMSDKAQEDNINILRLKRYNIEIPEKLEDLTLKLSS